MGQCKLKGELLVGDNLPNDLTWKSDLLYTAMSREPIHFREIGVSHAETCVHLARIVPYNRQI